MQYAIDNGGTLSRRPGRLRMRRRIALACVLALTCLAAMSATAAENASASAFGVQYWGSFTVNVGGQTVGIPSGELGHNIYGRGTLVEQDSAKFLAAANICNWRIDFTYADALNGQVYEVDSGPTEFRCDHRRSRDTWPNAHKRPGKACAELYSNGAFIARQCHSITR